MAQPVPGRSGWKFACAVLVAILLLLLATTRADARERLLSLGGAVTETVFALHHGDALVATDLTSLYPPPAASLPKVGYLRALGAEGVLSLNPSLVLASADAGPPAAMAQIAAAGVRILSLPEAHTVASAIDRILKVGAELRHEAEAADIVKALRADLDQIAADIAVAPGRPRVLFLLSAGRGAPMAAGTNTAADAMIQLAGGVNAVTGFSGYRALSAESALLAEPDWIVTTSETLQAIGGVPALLAVPGLRQTPAGQAERVAAFEGLYLLGFGPRLAQARYDLAVALHPGAAIRPLPSREWAPSRLGAGR